MEGAQAAPPPQAVAVKGTAILLAPVEGGDSCLKSHISISASPVAAAAAVATVSAFQGVRGIRETSGRHDQLHGCRCGERAAGCGGRAVSGSGGTTSSLHHCHAPVFLVCSSTARTLAPEPGSCSTVATALRAAP